MSTTLPTIDASLSPSMINGMDDVCDRFEAAWKAGLRPRIEDYLGETAGPERSALWHELLVLELVYRRRQGERPTPEEYRARFPAQVNLVSKVLGEADLSVPSGPAITHRVVSSRVGVLRSGRIPSRNSLKKVSARRVGPRSLTTTSWRSWATVAWGWSTRPGSTS